MAEVSEIHPAHDWPYTRQWAIAKLVGQLGGGDIEEKYLKEIEHTSTGTTYEVVFDRDTATHVYVRVRR